ncbi:hypothetical protein B0H13DRAFT_1861890 [Mycena leptocephala]|nr:hypothetical protein B0H13DRAFT_1861890 [Mycena leptocephala]
MASQVSPPRRPYFSCCAMIMISTSRLEITTTAFLMGLGRSPSPSELSTQLLVIWNRLFDSARGSSVGRVCFALSGVSFTERDVFKKKEDDPVVFRSEPEVVVFLNKYPREVYSCWSFTNPQPLYSSVAHPTPHKCASLRMAD